MASSDGDPDHTILPNPFMRELVEFTYRSDPTDWRESYIDIVFSREGERRPTGPFPGADAGPE